MATTTPGALPRVLLYTDGGADPNPGPGGWGVVMIHPESGKTTELSGNDPDTTNNRMELTAAIRALESLKRPCEVHLFTDSLYLRKGVTDWLPGWQARGWRRKDGELKNEDLWRRLAELVGQHDMRWEWVKGHAGNVHNERADELATLAIRKLKGGAPKPGAEAEVFLKVSCPGRRGGWAALVRHGGEEKVLSGSRDGVTSNHLDLVAAAEALETLPPGTSVAVHSGSDYLRNGATRWLPGWKRSGWRTKEGEPVKNRDLWERLEAAMARRRVTWPDLKDAVPPEMKELGRIAGEEARRG